MPRLFGFALVMLLAASPALADVIELKTGQRVEGTLKQATPASVSVEVGGQTITFEGEKVRAIYFGSASLVSAPSPRHDALQAIKSLQSIANAGTTFSDYAPRVGDAKAVSDRYVSTAAVTEGPAASALDEVARCHTLAMRAWSERIANGRLDLRTDPVIIPCLLAKGQMRQSEATDPGPLAFATREALYLAQQAFWSCASDKIAEAEKLLAPVK